MRLLHDGDGDHGVGQARPENGHQRKGQEQARESEDNVHHPHDQRVENAAEEPGKQPDQHADHHGAGDDDTADEQRVARSVDQAGQHIAADGVGAQQETGITAILPDLRLKQRVTELLRRSVGRDDVGE
jgi:hypothetical protein